MTLELTTTGLLPDRLRARLELQTARIGVVGLGVVGLSFAETLAWSGYSVLGYEIDPEKVKHLKTGRSYIRHISSERIAELVATGRLEATTDSSALSEVDVIVICVPTPLTPAGEPDLSCLRAAAQTVGQQLRRGQLIVLESATYPGTTEDLLRPLLEEAGLRAGRDFFLAYSPARDDPGNAHLPSHAAPKVVGGIDEVSRDLAVILYEPVLDGVIPVSSTRVAEACKMLESAYRAVNIALVNELKVLFEALGIDIWEVIAAARTNSLGFQPFYPGPGAGGHAVAIAPLYLTWAGRQVGTPAPFLERASAINRAMPGYVVQRVAQALDEQGKTLRGSRICILGVAYKKNGDDAQESPGLAILQLLLGQGAYVTYNDPHIRTLPCLGPQALRLESEPLSREFLATQDCVLIVTDHSAYNYEWIARHTPLVIDTRNAVDRLGLDSCRVVRA